MPDARVLKQQVRELQDSIAPLQGEVLRLKAQLEQAPAAERARLRTRVVNTIDPTLTGLEVKQSVLDLLADR